MGNEQQFGSNFASAYSSYREAIKNAIAHSKGFAGVLAQDPTAQNFTRLIDKINSDFSQQQSVVMELLSGFANVSKLVTGLDQMLRKAGR